MARLELKTQVERGSYRPPPELIATAMLRRRGMRAFLLGGGSVSGADRNRTASPDGRPQAA